MSPETRRFLTVYLGGKAEITEVERKEIEELISELRGGSPQKDSMPSGSDIEQAKAHRARQLRQTYFEEVVRRNAEYGQLGHPENAKKIIDVLVADFEVLIDTIIDEEVKDVLAARRAEASLGQAQTSENNDLASIIALDFGIGISLEPPKRK
jgi:hypothetical protein